jgi:chemotaxis protein CheY-P-specific phosphatase CheC
MSASVITQFSNLLKVKLFGSVPDLKSLKTKELVKYISNMSENMLYMLFIECDFSNDNMTLNPQFIWILDAEFLSKIKIAANDNNFIETVNQQYNSINDI